MYHGIVQRWGIQKGWPSGSARFLILFLDLPIQNLFHHIKCNVDENRHIGKGSPVAGSILRTLHLDYTNKL